MSVLPAYLIPRVSQSIVANSSAANTTNSPSATRCHLPSSKSPHNQPRSQQHLPKTLKPFHELFVQVHENVSILFADIVNFTVLAAQLSAKELVRTLNELYSKFDEDAQKLQCMRIKFLGRLWF